MIPRLGGELFEPTWRCVKKRCVARASGVLKLLDTISGRVEFVSDILLVDRVI